jgi:hypothetical protein
MATYTITDILGSDNMASSRKEIASNFKILADGLNKTETFLNSSPSGGELNIANVLVKKYTKTTTDTIFTCEAGMAAANLALSETLSVTGTSSLKGKVTIGTVGNTTSDLEVANGNISATGNIKAGAIILPVDITPIAASLTALSTVNLASSISIDWNSSQTLNLSNNDGVADGKLLIIRNINGSGTYTIQSGGVTIATFTPTGVITNTKIILQFAGGNWDVISVFGATIS